MPHTHNEKIQKLLLEIRDEMHDAELDAETQKLLHKFDAEIHSLVGDGQSSTAVESALDHAKSLQAEFSVTHPVANRFLTEAINTLVKMGV